MKRLINLQSKNNNRIIVIAASITVFFIDSPVYAKLTNAANALKNLKEELTGKIIPVAAAVILLCLAIGYAGRYIGKDTFIRWAIGVVIAGSAVQLTGLLFTP
ncbi:conjugal transfer protein [Bartonella henselae]|uniref:TrwL5 protein n=1 Tax=Bartonella henselae TaxID=38323 RepID=B0RK67_BARHN|nr:VirB2 family type IV secretion system major pilin TrwL5 [Bartonella henselae]MDM9997048.1 VirB2 family type IV secretion system major pilin TrwL5 [Bartonella henselae]OLL49100.1 conjugal transfer protein [Bartonella henselae]OLL51196.1 conjugal transfer protein [Bartonella henselae]OLL51896.1 conjugal transfer protein [Bartonella henselae]OLL57034.1 conjugal transfer protein [Bartonella henselae]